MSLPETDKQTYTVEVEASSLEEAQQLGKGAKRGAPTGSHVAGVITPALLHLLALVVQEASYGQPLVEELEARQELLACFDEEYLVMQRAGTLILVKK